MSARNEALLGWLKEATDEQVKKTGSTRGYLLQIGYGNKNVSAEMAARIEQATAGVVTRKQLRPKDWETIWPELAAA